MTENALQPNTLLYKSSIKIQDVLEANDSEITYSAYSFVDGKEVIVKEYFTKDCIRKIDGGVGALWISDDVLKNQISQFMIDKQDENKSMAVFEENGTAYYILAQQNEQIQKSQNIPSQTDIIGKTESVLTSQDTIFSVPTIKDEADSILDYSSSITEKSLIEQEKEDLKRKQEEDRKRKKEADERQMVKDNADLFDKNRAELNRIKKQAQEQNKANIAYAKKIQDEEDNLKNLIGNKTNQKQAQQHNQKQLQQLNQKQIQKKKSGSNWWLWITILGVGGYLMFSPDAKKQESVTMSDAYVEKEAAPVIDYEKKGDLVANRAWALKGGKYGFLDENDSLVIPYKYENVTSFDGDNAGYQLNGLWGFLDNTGKEFITPKYEAVRNFSEGMAWVNLRGKFGFINEAGEEVVPLIYDGARDFKDGLGWVIRQKKVGFVDKQGNEIIFPKYEGAWDFSEGLAGVLIRQKVGFINKKGVLVIPPKFDDIRKSFENGEALVKVGVDSFYINPMGIRINPEE